MNVRTEKERNDTKVPNGKVNECQHDRMLLRVRNSDVEDSSTGLYTSFWNRTEVCIEVNDHESWIIHPVTCMAHVMTVVVVAFVDLARYVQVHDRFGLRQKVLVVSETEAMAHVVST